MYAAGPNSIDCGVFVIARVEAFLNKRQLASQDGPTLRLQYLRIILQLPEAADRLLVMGASLPKRKRENSSPAPTKRFKEIFPRMIIENKQSSIYLQSLGENWTNFLRDYFPEATCGSGDLSSVDRGYGILALVYALGSPEVMLSLSKILRELRKEPSQPKNWTQTAMKLYKEAEIGSVYYKMQKLAAAMYMYCHYQEKRSFFQM